MQQVFQSIRVTKSLNRAVIRAVKVLDFDRFIKEKRSEEQIATGGNYLYPAPTDGSLRGSYPLRYSYFNHCR